MKNNYPKTRKTPISWKGRRARTLIGRKEYPVYYLDTSSCVRAARRGFVGSCLDCPLEKCLEGVE